MRVGEIKDVKVWVSKHVSFSGTYSSACRWAIATAGKAIPDQVLHTGLLEPLWLTPTCTMVAPPWMARRTASSMLLWEWGR